MPVPLATPRSPVAGAPPYLPEAESGDATTRARLSGRLWGLSGVQRRGRLGVRALRGRLAWVARRGPWLAAPTLASVTASQVQDASGRLWLGKAPAGDQAPLPPPPLSQVLRQALLGAPPVERVTVERATV